MPKQLFCMSSYSERSIHFTAGQKGCFIIHWEEKKVKKDIRCNDCGGICIIWLRAELLLKTLVTFVAT